MRTETRSQPDRRAETDEYALGCLSDGLTLSSDQRRIRKMHCSMKK